MINHHPLVNRLLLRRGASATKIFVATLLCVVLYGCAAPVRQVQYGSDDMVSAAQIERLNRLAQLRADLKYDELADALRSDLIRYAKNPYAVARLRNELAELFSFQLLDLEEAVRLDNELLAKPSIGEDDGSFVPPSRVANERILADKAYVRDFVEIPASRVTERARTRLEANLELLNGRNISTRRAYSKGFLVDHLATVRADLARVPKNSSDFRKLSSRLMRAEYELARVDQEFAASAHLKLLSGELRQKDVDLTEIDFLSLADHLVTIAKQSRNARLAEMALEILYLPYVNMRDANFRWRYNKLINTYVDFLIELNYEQGHYEEMLYFTNLNKSRVLLEERLAFGSSDIGANRIAALAVADGIPRTDVGLPSKPWFLQRLAVSAPYVDFYVAGNYVEAKLRTQSSQIVDRSSLPLTTRDFGLEGNTEFAEIFSDNALYAAVVLNGKVSLVKRLTGDDLAATKFALDESYRSISSKQRMEARFNVPLFDTLRAVIKLPASVVVSPDKWVSKHPLDLYLGVRVTRAVNFFTAGDSQRIAQLDVVGFFNPTLDLAGAEQEADAIQAVLPSAKIFRRESALLSALQSAKSSPAVHLSMHGAFNNADPMSSKLFFAGSQRGLGANDTNALYAKDMAKYAALRDRDLIFAAACQTGLSGSDQSNERELMGILRPLTANRNKNIILSLWKVDDAATKDFVTSFYGRLVKSKDVAESFHAAQDEVRRKYVHPYYWAAFFLSQSR